MEFNNNLMTSISDIYNDILEYNSLKFTGNRRNDQVVKHKRTYLKKRISSRINRVKERILGTIVHIVFEYQGERKECLLTNITEDEAKKFITAVCNNNVKILESKVIKTHIG